MSAEAFTTPLSCDMRTAEDWRGVEYAPSGTQQPRITDRWRAGMDGLPDPTVGQRTWADCYLYAENAVEVAARSVETEPMTGISGDHPERRQAAAAVLRAAAKVVREMALDSAGDGYLSDDDWHDVLADVVTSAQAAMQASGAADPDVA